MNSGPKSIDAYIGSFRRPLEEAYLQELGFGKGMIMFAIPCYGVLFKCRAEGDLIDLEFGAFFALLRFIKTSLVIESLKTVRVHSSNPDFVFAVMNQGAIITGNPERARMLKEYRDQHDIQVALVPAIRNQTRVPPGDFPSTPRDQASPIQTKATDKLRIRFRPIQKGTAL